ncbi:MAG: cytochrome P450 [Gaiellaceae bacterium]
MTGSAAAYEKLLDLRELSSAPYDVYRQLREEAPVLWSDSQNAWLVSRYDDVKAVLEDKERFSSAARVKRSETSDAVWEAFAGFTGFFWSDPPAYTLDREAWSRAFKPRLKGIPALVQGVVDELLDDVETGSVVDVVAALAFPLPATVVFDLLGVPRADRDMFREVSAVLIGGGEEIAVAIEECAAWLRSFLEERQREPRDDMLSDLTAALPPIETLSDRELRMQVVNIVQFLLAGHETTTSTIASGLLQLLLRPDEQRLFVQERTARSTAVEEMLRFESPLQFIERRVARPTTLSGFALEADDTVKLLLGSANHDERVFADPDAFDIRRSPNPHLAFGYGIHLCLGAPLARIEIPIAIEAMLRRFPGARLACAPDEIRWRQNFMFHAIEELPIATSS